MDLAEALLADPAIVSSPLARELAVVMARPTGRSSASFPYLEPSAWTRFRDWVPHLLAHGPRVLDAVSLVEAKATALGADVGDAARVVRQVVLTAAITAPSDLWLSRYVVDALQRVGVAKALVDGETVAAERSGLVARELAVDLRFLLARGYLLRSGGGYRLATHAHARRVLAELPLLDDEVAAVSARSWARAIQGSAEERERRTLEALAESTPMDLASTREAGLWCASPEEIEVGFRLAPLIVGMQAAGVGVEVMQLCPAAGRVLRAAGVVDERGAPTAAGARVLERGAGPMGIIEAYHPYLVRLVHILTRGRGQVWVERSANVAASQLANAKSFEQAHDALDALCRTTGFRYSVFIEHALGRGEATRQRFERSGDSDIQYVGADLEDAAIDGALEEQGRGRLPRGMRFVRKADIGKPAVLLEALRSFGLEPSGAVMIVGNGFHEVREQTDEHMTRVFEGYCRAGIVLLFTEETALAAEDLLETAWNTYHAGFKYVHERSGQGLRPATPTPPSALDDGVAPASWSECAERAGYVRADELCVKSRTVYPYPPPGGHNPSISVTHVFVPRALAEELGLS